MSRKKKFTFEESNNFEMESAFEKILSLSPRERSHTEGYEGNYSGTVTKLTYLSKAISRTSDYEEMSTTERETYEETVVDEDDEVFLDTEKSNGIAIVQSQGRERRCSDVVDTIPSMSPKFSMEGNHLSSHWRFSVYSPPGTPGSDGGYSSTALPSPQPTEFPLLRARWDRMSAPERVNPYIPSNTRRKSNINDSVDANPMQPQDQPINTSSYSSPVAHMPVAKDSHVYNMDHKYRGPALIFNNISFSTEKEREGSDVDVNRLTEVFEKLDFEVTTYTDVRLKEMMDILETMSAKDYSACDCFVIIILTHGTSNNVLYTKEGMYHIHDIWSYFLPYKCPSLAGKPKLYFVQACRGDMLDHGLKLVSSPRDPRRTETDSGCASYKIPTMSDFLFGQSSFEGYFSFRNPEKGSWYIQSLCDVIEEFHLTTDLLSMLTIVSRKVALEYESFNDYQYFLHEKKQIPTVTHTLMRNIFLKPKTTEAGELGDPL